jgi:energy-coupling factor transport system substrate-specific component
VNPLGWIQALQGLTLLAIICGLLFVEELGVPIFFAPGDLLLAIGGIAVAAGRVNPLLMGGAALVAILVGASVGREAFALLGWNRLMRVARPLRVEDALDRAAKMMERNGWRGIFTARLIPGLRVHTTQIAGVTRMPRLTFWAGLVPAAVLYVAAFIGLGAAFGRPILEVIHRAEHQVLTLILVAGIVIAVILVLRRVAAGVVPEIGGWAVVFRFQPDSPGLFAIPAAIGLNFAGHALAVGLKLPLFLDSIGTVLSALLLGPWLGGGVGFISNLLVANTFDPSAAIYAVVAFAIGFAVGWAWRLRTGYATGGWLPLWLIAFSVASLLSTPLNIAFQGGRPGLPLADAIHTQLIAWHVPVIAAALVSEAAIDLPDKMIAVLAALVLYNTLPRPAPSKSSVVLDVGAAFTYVFHSTRWFRRLVVGTVCILFSWLLLIPFWLFLGYSVAAARRARQASPDLPPWDDLGAKIKDGFLITLLLGIWYLPGVFLALPANIASQPAAHSWQGAIVAFLAVLSGVWYLVVVTTQAAIWSQYLDGGFWNGFNVQGILNRIRVNMGLTVVVGALGIALFMVAIGGAALAVIGVALTLPYATLVAAHLFGQYSTLTEQQT